MITRENVRGAYPVKPLGQLAEFLDNMRRPVKESDRNPGPYPYYGANGQQGTIDGFLFDEPLILLAEDGGFFDTPERGIAYRISGKSWVNNHAHIIKPGKGIDLAYLCRVLENYDVRPFISGTTRAKLTKGQAEKIEIPLPPLDEQKRIAAILDQADELRRLRQRVIDRLNELGQAIFYEMFGDPVANPRKWPCRTIGNIGLVMTGNTPPRAINSYYGNEIEWIKSDNINTPHYYLTKAEEGLSSSGKKVARIAPSGSILVTCIAGSPACIGNVAMTDREVAFNQQINAVIPQEGNAHFLYEQLLVGKKLIQQASTKGMKGLVSKSRFEAISLIFPPISLQEEFARRTLAIEKTKISCRGSQEALEALFASLQHRAFKGDLTSDGAATELEMAG